MIMERQIGDKFLTPEGVELEVVEVKDNGCEECYYWASYPINDCVRRTRIGGYCSPHIRVNKKSIIFRKVK